MLRDGYTLTEELISSVSEFVAKRSMIGTTYELKEYIPQEVNIVAKMYVDSDYDKDKLIEDITSYLETVVFAYGELLMGEHIAKSDLENEIKTTFEGILSFRINTPEEDIIKALTDSSVLTLGTVEINAEYL